MLQVKVILWRKGKGPITLDSMYVDETQDMTIRQMQKSARDFIEAFLKENPDFQNVKNLDCQYICRG